MRLFFAVVLPDEILDRIEEAQGRLRAQIGDEGVRWTKREQFHYTLKFLGEQPPARMAKALEAARSIRSSLAPFEFRPGGLGAFPNERRPSTLWVGAAVGGDEMSDLAGALDRALIAERFPRETKPLKAHLTLARIKSYSGETAVARALRTPETAETGDLGTVIIDRFVLMQSTLKPSGSEYRMLEEFGFVS